MAANGSRPEALSAAWLAARTAGIRCADLPASVRERALRVALDTLAVATAGMADPFCNRFADDLVAAGKGGSSSVCARPEKSAAEAAALLNSMATTVLQFDEGHRESRSHPGIHVVPAVLAIAEEQDLAGDRLVEAIAAGYEVTARIALHYGNLPGDVHTHGTSGAFGAAVAAAKLLGAGESELEATLEAVATIPILPWQHTTTSGATVHHLYASLGVHLGVTMARAVCSGLTVSPDILEAHYHTKLGGGRLGSWERDGHELLRNYFKLYPACAHVHTSLEIVERLQRAGGWQAEDVEWVDVFLFAPAHRLNDPQPKSNLAARFSVPFLLATAITSGLKPRVFQPSELSDPQVLSLSRRIHVRHDAELDEGYPRSRPARVRVRLRDGTEQEDVQSMPEGDYENPAPEGRWAEKMQSVLGPGNWKTLQRFVTQTPESWRARELGEAFAAMADVVELEPHTTGEE